MDVWQPLKHYKASTFPVYHMSSVFTPTTSSIAMDGFDDSAYTSPQTTESVWWHTQNMGSTPKFPQKMVNAKQEPERSSCRQSPEPYHKKTPHN